MLALRGDQGWARMLGFYSEEWHIVFTSRTQSIVTNSHQAGSTHWKPWMACWTPYPCWSGWALKWETKSKILSELSLMVQACDPSTWENQESSHIASLKLAWVTYELFYQKKKRQIKTNLALGWSGTGWCWGWSLSSRGRGSGWLQAMVDSHHGGIGDFEAQRCLSLNFYFIYVFCMCVCMCASASESQLFSPTAKALGMECRFLGLAAALPTEPCHHP